ncbi:hypothetical protein PROFUN_08667 [Planoprotostelium fungivorum]|uniref:Origin recognition complex subunit 1 n=1 Tax=Planoprotostelium fungivorum TaxID=1890364 RepID=A0A2P6NJ40_9EUKA|nr:hypothetical protein PROFUN_08667 [Planoprotostelium fungivorum]
MEEEETESPSNDKEIATSTSKTDLKEVEGNVFELVREKLHISTIPESLPCREEQREQIAEVLMRSIKERSNYCLCESSSILSGVPGTGKTATVVDVVNSMLKKKMKFKFVEVNGMRLTQPKDCYSVILQQLNRNTGKRESASAAIQKLNKLFASKAKAPKQPPLPIILLIDEMDLLVTKSNSVLYNLFEWPTRKFVSLTVIGISNTLNLPELMTPRVSSRLGLEKIIFHPYRRDQLVEIIRARVQAVDIFEEQATLLVAAKVASVSGDARRALELCRRASSIAEMEWKEADETGRTTGKIRAKHINTAIKDMFGSHRSQSMKFLDMTSKLFLLSVVLSVKRKGLAEVSMGFIYDQLSLLYNRYFPELLPNFSMVREICAELHQQRLIMMDAKRGTSQMVTLNVNDNEVLFALSEDDTLRQVVQDESEVNHLDARETS